MKPKIKFIHDYYKIPAKFRGTNTYILGLQVCELRDLPDAFIFWDTRYGNKNYILPKGKLMIITLFTYNEGAALSQLWTTIRRWTSKKEKYYRGLIGKEVEIIIEKELEK